MQYIRFCICLVLLFATSMRAETSLFGKSSSWQEFTAASQGFSVEVPSTPDHIKQKIDIPNTRMILEYNTYISEPSDKVVYVISVWEYPAEVDMSHPEINLQDGFNGMLAALPDARVLSKEISDVQGFKSLEFHVKSEDILFQGKVIIVHNTLYQVFTVYRESVDMKSDYTRFINSFKLLHPEQQRKESLNRLQV